jgi:hypothetical protein
MMVSPSQGQAVEVTMVGRDSVVGVCAALDRGVSLTNAIVVAPGTASVLKAEDLRVAAGRSSTLRNLVARHQQALPAHARQSAACNASHSVEARLSRLLLRARDLCDSEGSPLTQEFLAQMIGARRNAVSIVAHVSAGGHRQLQPRPYRNYGYRWFAENLLRMLLGSPAAMRPVAAGESLTRHGFARSRVVIDHRILARRQASDTRC